MGGDLRRVFDCGVVFEMTDEDIIESLRRDAMRYRWLRDSAHDWGDAGIVRLEYGPDFDNLSGEELDAAIDKAMEGK